jgi:hypothetical protein
MSKQKKDEKISIYVSVDHHNFICNLVSAFDFRLAEAALSPLELHCSGESISLSVPRTSNSQQIVKKTKSTSSDHSNFWLSRRLVPQQSID